MKKINDCVGKCHRIKRRSFCYGSVEQSHFLFDLLDSELRKVFFEEIIVVVNEFFFGYNVAG